MRKWIAMLLAGAMLLSLTACEQGAAADPGETAPKVVLVATETGLGDGSTNDMAYEGLLSAGRDYDVETVVMEPQTEEEYANFIAKAAEEGADLVIGLRPLSSSKMKKIAKEHPDTAFAFADTEKELGENVMSLAFKQEEAAFLAGIIAASMSSSKIVGFVGSAGGAIEESYEYGFRSGVKAVNPDAQVLADYTESTENTALGRIAALSQIGRGADVLFHAPGKWGEGVDKAAGDMGVSVIGFDPGRFPPDRKSVLCSVFRRVDHAVYLAIQTLQEGDFEGGVYDFGLDFEAVGYRDSRNNLPEEVEALANAYGKAVAAGDIYVPKNRADFENFTVPEEGFPIQVKTGE